MDALQRAGDIQPGGLIVLGCSTSEVAGARIGKGSVPELGEVIARAMLIACRERGLNAAFQCCEHLNRAIVMEQRVLKELRLTQVRAIPQPITYGIREKSEEIAALLEQRRSMPLRELYALCKSRSELVAAFISVLELCSDGMIHVTNVDGDFTVSRGAVREK